MEPAAFTLLAVTLYFATYRGNGGSCPGRCLKFRGGTRSFSCRGGTRRARLRMGVITTSGADRSQVIFVRSPTQPAGPKDSSTPFCGVGSGGVAVGNNDGSTGTAVLICPQGIKAGRCVRLVYQPRGKGSRAAGVSVQLIGGWQGGR